MLRKTINFKSEKHVFLSYSMFLLSNALVSFTLLCLIGLQSSLNIESGLAFVALFLGVTSLAVFGSFQALATFFVRGLCKVVSPKAALILSDVLCLPYIIANFSPKFYTMVPAAVFFGIARGIFWVISSLFIVGYTNSFAHFGRKYYEVLSLTNACFLASYFGGQILGNLVPYLVIDIEETTSDRLHNQSSLTNTTSDYFLLNSTNQQSIALKDICGANDCQDSSVLAETNIVHPSSEMLYLLMAILTAIFVIGILLKVIFAPPFKAEMKVQSEKNDIFLKNRPTSPKCDDKKYEKADPDNEYESFDANDEKTEEHSKLQNEDGSARCKTCEDFDEKNEDLKQQKLSKMAVIYDEFKTSLLFLTNPHQLLLAPICLHAGSGLAFTSGEITRAFVSCVFGVKQVGICMSVCGLSSLLGSILTGNLSAKFGRKLCVGLGCVIHSSVYIFGLFWEPDENSNVLIAFFMVAFYGFADAVFTTIATETLLVHFPNMVNGVFVSYTFWYCVGLTLQYGWSTSLCVRTKFYVLFFILYFAAITFGIAEYKHSKKTKNQNFIKQKLDS